jgi:hypothetical protein
MGYLLAHWHEVAYLLLAAIIVAIYIVHFLPTLKHSPLRKILEAETILIVILICVAIIAARVETVSHDVEERTGLISGTLDEVLRTEGLARVQRIDGIEELFAELNAARQRAGKEIRLTRMRIENPADLETLAGETRLWYEGMDNWLNSVRGRVFYQVIGVSNEKVQAWFDGECADGGGSANRGMRRVESMPNAPQLNYAIFDKAEVFIVASPLHGLLAATRVYHVEDEGFAEFIASAYDDLYRGATPCGGRQ